MSKEFRATIAALIGVFIAIAGLMIALIADVRSDMNAAHQNIRADMNAGHDLIYAELREIRNDQQEMNTRVGRIEGHLFGIEANDAPP